MKMSIIGYRRTLTGILQEYVGYYQQSHTVSEEVRIIWKFWGSNYNSRAVTTSVHDPAEIGITQKTG
jgi:hypothetical protein